MPLIKRVPRPSKHREGCGGAKDYVFLSELRAVICKHITYEERSELIQKICEKAKAGDEKAAQFVIERIYGRPSTLHDERLAHARAALAEQQLESRLAHAQAEFIKSQTIAKIKETALVEAQFVTEEEERARMQRLAESINRPLLHMTPEIAASFGITDPDKLEDLKAYLGRGQQEVLREVFSEEDPNRITHEDDGYTQAEEVWEEESE